MNLLDFFSWVQGERILGQADLQVSMAKFSLSRSIKLNTAFIIAGYWIQNHTVMAGRDHSHPSWREEDSAGG